MEIIRCVAEHELVYPLKLKIRFFLLPFFFFRLRITSEIVSHMANIAQQSLNLRGVPQFRG